MNCCCRVACGRPLDHLNIIVFCGKFPAVPGGKLPTDGRLPTGGKLLTAAPGGEENDGGKGNNPPAVPGRNPPLVDTPVVINK